MTLCKDCKAIGLENRRPIAKAGRCATHNRERRRALRKRAHGRRLEVVYGITAEFYEALLFAQGGLCAICQRARGVSKKLSVDHDHKQAVLDGHPPETGCRECVRGLLCGTCNKMLGHLRDDPAAFSRAAAYLLDWPSKRATPVEAPAATPTPTRRARATSRTTASGAGAKE